MKYNTPNSILTCLAFDNNKYKTSKAIEPKTIPSFIISGSNEQASEYLKDYVWPSKTDSNYKTRMA
jgi:hypothetical protein